MARDPEIHDAVKHNDIKEIKKLLSTNHDINCLGTDGETPLYLALHVRSQESAIFLLEHGAKYFKGESNHSKEVNMLHEAAQLGTELVAKWLLENGSNANGTNRRLNETPLHRATTVAVAQTLLELGGADVNAKCFNGSQPIHWAIHSNRLDVVKTLLDHGADVNATDDNGETPLHGAADNSNLEMLQLLLDNGADVNARTEAGATLLHFVNYDRLLDREIVEEILKHDIDIDAQDETGQTPLHCVTEFPEVVKMFLRKGADINIRSEFDGDRPLDDAMKYYKSLKCTNDNYDNHGQRTVIDHHEVGPGEELVTHDELEEAKDMKCTIDCLIQHETKLKALGFYIDDELVRDVKRSLFNDLTHGDCELEFNRLKVNVCESLKDIIRTKYPRYLSNKDICDRLAIIDVAKYPIYGELILDKMERDKKRMVKLERCASLFAKSELEPTLPVNIWERILSNLKDAELTGILRKQNKRKTVNPNTLPSAKYQRIA